MHDYAAAIIDWRMPEISGVDVVREARSHHVAAPLLMLTARDSITDRVEGLDAGADDYLVKPFEFDELLARLRSMLRRSARTALKSFAIGDLRLNQQTRTASVADTGIELSPKEYAILEMLVSRAPGTIPVREFALHVWEDESQLVGSNTIHVHISRLRRKLGQSQVRIVNVRGQGFRLETTAL
jgi:DNA-binding response OmpR family regulator